MKGLGREIAVALAYGVLGIVFLMPLSLHPLDTVAFVGDGLGSVYFVSEMARRLFEQPGQLFDAGIAYPHAHASLFEAHRLLIALLAAPFLWITGNPIFATNVVTLLAYTFNGWSARHLARRLGLSDPAAFVAGCLFAFNTYALNESPRVNVVFLGFLPLAIGSLLGYMETGERRDAWKVALFMLAQAYSENYYLVYGSIVLVLILVPYLWFRFRVTVTRLRGLAVPTLLAAALFLPVMNAYLDMDNRYDYRREAPQTMGIEHYFAPLAGNVVYGSLGRKTRGQQMGAHFVGFMGLGLAAAAIVAALLGRGSAGDETALIRPSTWVLAGAGLALTFLLLSLGRNVQWSGIKLMPGPFGFLYDHVALFQRLRIPERLSLIVMLFVGLLAARGLSLMPSRGFRLALCLILPLEHLTLLQNWVRIPVGGDIPEVYRYLKTDSATAVAEAPIQGEGLVRMESLEMYYSLFHEKPITEAYLSFPPLLLAILRRRLAEFPGSETLDALRRVRVDTLVLHIGRDGGAAMKEAAEREPARSQLRLVASFPNRAHVLTQSGGDLGDPGMDAVYRIEPRPIEKAAPLPSGVRITSHDWAYRSSAGPAWRLGDADLDTLWKSENPVHGGEFIEIGFHGASVMVSGVTLPLTRLQALPSSFVIEGRNVDGSWEELSAYDAAHRRQLIDTLMVSPGFARLGFAFAEPKTVQAIRLRATPGAESFDGWCLSEIEILAPAFQ
ncbi:MAG: hypothetical protein ABI672_00395 [Vicinamibacteria bacterium]